MRALLETIHKSEKLGDDTTLHLSVSLNDKMISQVYTIEIYLLTLGSDSVDLINE